MGCAVQADWFSRVSFLGPPPGTPFPKTFLQAVRKILSRLFRVFVHVYIHHFDRIAQMGSEAHVNTCYKHFYYFVTEFSLIDPKELEPLVSWGWGSCLLPGWDRGYPQHWVTQVGRQSVMALVGLTCVRGHRAWYPQALCSPC